MYLFSVTADGVALGAATSVSQTGLTFIVFVAIMLHKVCIFSSKVITNQ